MECTAGQSSHHSICYQLDNLWQATLTLHSDHPIHYQKPQNIILCLCLLIFSSTYIYAHTYKYLKYDYLHPLLLKNNNEYITNEALAVRLLPNFITLQGQHLLFSCTVRICTDFGKQGEYQ